MKRCCEEHGNPHGLLNNHFCVQWQSSHPHVSHHLEPNDGFRNHVEPISRPGITGKCSICNQTSQHYSAAGFSIWPQAGTEERRFYMTFLLYPCIVCLFCTRLISNQSRDCIYTCALIMNKTTLYIQQLWYQLINMSMFVFGKRKEAHSKSKHLK